MKCSNSSDGIGRVISPRCYKNQATVAITITYDKYNSDSDCLLLCDDCAKRVAEDAKGRGYKVEQSKL